MQSFLRKKNVEVMFDENLNEYELVKLNTALKKLVRYKSDCT